MAEPEFEQVVEQSHNALDAFVRGDSKPLESLYSHTDDMSIANPFGPPVRGWSQGADAIRRAALNYRDGRALGFDRMAEGATSELRYIVEMERYEARIGGRDEITPVTLRVTSIYRLEGGGWKIVHRHADPITSARTAESVIQQ